MTRTLQGIRALLTGMLTAIFAACTVGVDLTREAPEQQRFVLDANRSHKASAPTGAPALILGPVVVVPEFERRAFVYQVGDRRFEGDFNHQWFTSPRDQVARVAGDWLRDSGLFSDVLPPALSGIAHYRLDITVTELFWDRRNFSRQVAHVGLAVHLTRGGRTDREVVYSARVAGAQTAESPSVEARVLAMSAALAIALSEVESGINAHMRAPEPLPP